MMQPTTAVYFTPQDPLERLETAVASLTAKIAELADEVRRGRGPTVPGCRHSAQSWRRDGDTWRCEDCEAEAAIAGGAT